MFFVVHSADIVSSNDIANPPQGGNSFSAKSSVLSITHNLFIGKFFSGNHLNIKTNIHILLKDDLFFESKIFDCFISSVCDYCNAPFQFNGRLY